MSIDVKISYVTTLPKYGNAPAVTVKSNSNDIFLVEFVDNDTNRLLSTEICENNGTVYGKRQWYTNWLIRILDKDENILYVERFDPTGKVIFIKSDSYALGDTIAWIPYFEEFMKKYACTVICSTFFNDLFSDVYPDLLFVKPNTEIKNVYAQYYIGAQETYNLSYSPNTVFNIPLQQVATDILGFEYREKVPKVRILNKTMGRYPKKYVCISEHASSETKEWHYPDGWQKIVDTINELGYEVFVISLEPSELKNVVNLTGDKFNLDDRIAQIYGAELFIGVSSGLSWLSWAVGTHTLMISDISPGWHEFQSNITRIENYEKGKFVDYTPTTPTDFEKVNDEVVRLLS